ncbi:acyltransferase family protein [Lutibacter holmesii]|uniref:Acyltransferase family protein n=1 Tax=Lutibacter holmesii TaxID=1137985 RepID=A0ABW3WJ18_9FLAO
MPAKRLLALDVMRGLTIALMIMVNTPGSWSYVYAPLLHSKWNGCTPTDLVFPFFLFIVGVSMWFSFKKFNNGITKNALFKVVKRALIMFLLGVFLNGFPLFDFENLRYLGVLQRIAIAYLIGALLCMQFNYKQILVAFGIILIGYWGLLYFSVTEGPYDLATNLVRKIDLLLLGEQHIYSGFGLPFDPEGLLSAIPSVGTLLMGYFTGRFIERSSNTMKAIKKLLSIGAIATSIGWVWNFVFPINKALWTSSYVLYTGGLAMVFLAVLLWFIDVKGFKKWSTPFIHFGTNPLAIYMFSGIYVLTISYLIKITTASGEVISGYNYLYSEVFVPIAGNMNGSLLFAITHIIFFWLITYVLYIKKIFIKI